MNGRCKGYLLCAWAVSELILPSTTGKSVPAGFHLLQEDNSGHLIRRAEGGAGAGTQDLWHYLLSCPGQGSLSLVGGQAEPLRGWGQGRSGTR